MIADRIEITDCPDLPLPRDVWERRSERFGRSVADEIRFDTLVESSILRIAAGIVPLAVWGDELADIMGRMCREREIAASWDRAGRPTV